ncbi:MAG TPA: hypothetical protein VM347_25530 [Nonomuraea sp.]|nr:hypothetical protein [Nonomuraea sp.]
MIPPNSSIRHDRLPGRYRSRSCPALSKWNLSLTYAGYAFFALLSFLFVTKFVKETKGPKLEEMG